jgi:hypothetical protein
MAVLCPSFPPSLPLICLTYTLSVHSLSFSQSQFVYFFSFFSLRLSHTKSLICSDSQGLIPLLSIYSHHLFSDFFTGTPRSSFFPILPSLVALALQHLFLNLRISRCRRHPPHHDRAQGCLRRQPPILGGQSDHEGGPNARPGAGFQCHGSHRPWMAKLQYHVSPDSPNSHGRARARCREASKSDSAGEGGKEAEKFPKGQNLSAVQGQRYTQGW